MHLSHIHTHVHIDVYIDMCVASFSKERGVEARQCNDACSKATREHARETCGTINLVVLMVVCRWIVIYTYLMLMY